ncbi:MAG: ZIP family metal transporter [Oscillibacter sp.]
MGLLGQVIGMTAVAGIGGTGLGGVVSCVLGRTSERMVSLLLSFAAGIMTGVVCFDLVVQAVFPEAGGGRTPLWLVAGGILAGYGGIDRLNAWADRHSRPGQGGLVLAGLVIAAAIALHNVPEGMVIGASFAAAGEALPRSGVVMAGVIALHNIPEGMAVAVPLLAGGMKRSRAACITAATGAPTVLGAVGGYYLGTLGPTALALALSGASGAMLYVVFAELLPEATELWQSRLPPLAAVAGIVAGLVIILSEK